MPDRCPCGSDRPFLECCGPLLAGEEQAATAEQLMRSRYTAYVKSDEHYLNKTWHPSTRPESLGLDHHPQPQWKGLTIVNTSAGQALDRQGLVEFIVRYKINGRAARLHENSHFVRENGCWFYLKGEVAQ